MGLISWAKGVFGNIFKSKEEKLKEDSTDSLISQDESSTIQQDDFATKEPSISAEQLVDDVTSEDLTDYSKYVQKTKQEITDETELEKRKNELEQLKPKIPVRKFLNYQEKLNSIVDELAPTGRVIKTPTYSSQEEIQNNRYDIYRNIIMGAINDDDLAQKLYQSGILSNRIMCFIEIQGVIIDKQKHTPFSEVMEYKNITPDDLLENNIITLIQGYKGTVANFIRMVYNKFPHAHRNNKLLKLNSIPLESSTEMQITDVKVYFDFA